MPMRVQVFPGERSADFVRRVSFPGAGAPAPLTITISGGGAAPGDTSIPITALPEMLPRYTVLEFSGGQVVVTTADAPQGATVLEVERLQGKLGEGIEGPISGAETATWDRLYRLTGGESKDFSTSKTTEDNRPVTFESWTSAAGTSRKRVTGKEASVAHTGFYHMDDAGFREVREADAIDGYLHYVRYNFREDGSLVEKREGTVQVLDYTEPTSATDFLRATFTLDFYGEYEETYYEPIEEGDGEGEGEGEGE